MFRQLLGLLLGTGAHTPINADSLELIEATALIHWVTVNLGDRFAPPSLDPPAARAFRRALLVNVPGRKWCRDPRRWGRLRMKYNQIHAN